jgi:hypothetical protein
MSVSEMSWHLQQLCNIPVALRKEGETTVACPYCNESHFVGIVDGYVAADCDDRSSNVITINDREFVPNYGLVIYEYRKSKDHNKESYYEILGSPAAY